MNSINVTEVEIVTTSGCSRCSYSVPRDAVKKKHVNKLKALIVSKVSPQAEIDEYSEKSFHCII